MKQLIGSQVRVFDKDDHMMFEMWGCELVTITSTYIIVLITDEDPNDNYVTLVPLEEISSIDTIPETIKENNNE